MQQAMTFGQHSCRVELAVRDEFVIQQYQDAAAEKECEFNDEEAEYDLRSPYLVHRRRYGRDGVYARPTHPKHDGEGVDVGSANSFAFLS